MSKLILILALGLLLSSCVEIVGCYYDVRVFYNDGTTEDITMIGRTTKGSGDLYAPVQLYNGCIGRVYNSSEYGPSMSDPVRCDVRRMSILWSTIIEK